MPPEPNNGDEPKHRRAISFAFAVLALTSLSGLYFLAIQWLNAWFNAPR